MEEPLNLVKLTELMHLERRSRAIVARRGDLYEEVMLAIAEGDIPQDDSERALQTVRDILFLRRRKVMLIAADIYSGGQPEAKGLTKEERQVLSRVVAILRETDPFGQTCSAPPPEPVETPDELPDIVPEKDRDGFAVVEDEAAAETPAEDASPAMTSTTSATPTATRTSEPEPLKEETASAPAGPEPPEKGPITAEPEPSSETDAEPDHVVVRALDDIDFVSLERTYMVKRDDVFSVDEGTAELLVRSGKADTVAQGDSE